MSPRSLCRVVRRRRHGPVLCSDRRAPTGNSSSQFQWKLLFFGYEVSEGMGKNLGIRHIDARISLPFLLLKPTCISLVTHILIPFGESFSSSNKQILVPSALLRTSGSD